MERRDLLKSAGVMTLAALAVKAQAEEMGHHHHNHAGHVQSGLHSALLRATADCVQKGQACLAHCLVLLGDGDKSMARCAKAVNQMLALCGALQNLANQQSHLAPMLAKVALEGCTECKKACEEHANKHAECKACAESCAECIKQCQAVAV